MPFKWQAVKNGILPVKEQITEIPILFKEAL